uniref:FBA_2 domain-containing protein n=1 Tax=Caenorhabditis tropicalis TaxID=1561998 RepID=A0A1I7UGK5_9PELO
MEPKTLEILLKYVRFDQRASLALYIPSILPNEVSLDYFHLSDLSLTIDTVTYDFYEFWNFWIPSPPSKQEMKRIRDQKHFGNLFLRKIDLIGRWEHKVPLGITQGEAERKLIHFLIGKYEMVKIRRLRIDDVEDFMERIGEERKGKIWVEELGVQDGMEFQRICSFLNQGSFPLKKLEIEAKGDVDWDDERIQSARCLKIKAEPGFDSNKFLKTYLTRNHPQGTRLTLQVQNTSEILGIFDFLEENYSLKGLQLGRETIMDLGMCRMKLFEGSFWWIFDLEVLKLI